jgi:hypothetical protein
MKATTQKYDQYFVYDTAQLTNAIDNLMPIKVDKDGIYRIEILNIAVTFSIGYTPDALSCYLSLNGTQETQYGIVTVGGGNKTSQNGVLFPIWNPQGYYQTKVVNKISLAKNDNIVWNFVNGDLTAGKTSRLVVVFQVTEHIKDGQ